MSETTTEQQPFDPIENTPEVEPTVQTEPSEPLEEATEPVEKAAEETDESETEPAEDADKRMARMAHEMREAKKQARQLKAELQQLRGERPPAEPDAELDRKVQERAEQLSRQKVFVDTCNDIYAKGAAEYGKAAWDEEIKELSSMAGQYVPPVIIEAAQDAGNPHQILHYLAENPDEYEV
jgi:chromosome segregation ATPase